MARVQAMSQRTGEQARLKASDPRSESEFESDSECSVAFYYGYANK